MLVVDGGSDVVLMAKGSVDNTTAGHLFNSDGFVSHVRSGNGVMRLNRLSNDGNILEIYQDGADHGSIGTPFNVAMYVSGPTSTGAGLIFQQNEVIQPAKNKARSNNTIDIGSPTFNFKDLYLGGNIYLGGTGSANALDDYEEGTWTPTVSQGTVTLNGVAKYTKVGRLVTIHATNLHFSDYTTNAVLEIGGLPFTEDGDQVTGSAMWAGTDTDNRHGTSYISGTGKIRFYDASRTGGYDVMDHNMLSSASPPYRAVYFIATYFSA